MENGFSLSDLKAVMGDGLGSMGSGGLLILIVLFLLFGGGIGGNRMGDYSAFATAASQNEILSGQKFNNLDNKIDRLGNGIADATYALNNTIFGVQSNIGTAVTNEGRAIQSQLAECCCTNQRNVDALRFEMANYAAAANATTTAQTQKILDAITGNRMADMQNQINALQLQNAVAGVVRYPMASVYSSGNNPFCGCNNACA